MTSLETDAALIEFLKKASLDGQDEASAAALMRAKLAVDLARAARPLDGKVALVTGASRGIGRAIALELAKAGATLAVNYRTGAEQAHEVEEEIAGFGGNAAAVYADVSVGAEVRAMVSKIVDTFGKIDILVNNSGITRDRTLKKMTEDDWMAVINTNLNSVFHTTSAVAPGMIERNYGRIINITSMVGQAGSYGQSNYAAAKGGLIAFTKAAALELARYNVTVNAVSPGYTETEMVLKIPTTVQDQIKAKIPMGRFATPKEIADAVRFLASSADYVTGQQIAVNGGIYM